MTLKICLEFPLAFMVRLFRVIIKLLVLVIAWGRITLRINHRACLQKLPKLHESFLIGSLLNANTKLIQV